MDSLTSPYTTMAFRNAPSPSPTLLSLFGSAAIVTALWLVDHRAAFPQAGRAIPGLIGVFALCYTCALLQWMEGRRHRTAASVAGVGGMPTYTDPIYQGTVYGLTPGALYVVRQPFTDHYRNAFQPGERLRFKERHFLPYHGGHTLVFEERSIYLQEDQDRALLDQFSQYVARLEE